MVVRYPIASGQIWSCYGRRNGWRLSSVEGAYAVGVELETGDIADLSAAVEGSGEAATHRVYENLRAASENHLRAFEAAVSGRPIGGGRRWHRRRRTAEHGDE